MALDQSALLEVLDALKAADVGDRSVGLPKRLSGVIEAELIDTIGAALHERTESRTALRNGHRTRILSTMAGDRAPSSSASTARSRSAPDERPQPCPRPGSLRILWGAVGSAVPEGAARFGSWRSIACSSARNGAGAGGGAAAALQRVGE